MQAGSVMDHLVSAVAVGSEEAALVAELRAGSEHAFAELIAQYHQPLYSLIARSLQDPADASDITQEVFIKVFRNIRSFHGDSSLRTWLYRIALHEASNQRRWWSRHKRQEVAIEAPYCSHCEADSDSEGQSLGATLADGGCSPFDSLAQEEVRHRVEAALRLVPEAFRTVVVLREIEGFTYEEIADILRVNLGTVKSRLTRGRAALRLLLAPEKNSSCAHAVVALGVAGVTQQVSAAEPQGPLAKASRQCTHASPAPGSGGESLTEVSR
jgi:RNA polymerase sigma-70 factor (ECF subfamily)